MAAEVPRVSVFRRWRVVQEGTIFHDHQIEQRCFRKNAQQFGQFAASGEHKFASGCLDAFEGLDGARFYGAVVREGAIVIGDQTKIAQV